MAQSGRSTQRDSLVLVDGKPAHILVIQAPYYEAIAEDLLRGACTAIEAAGGSYEVISVPGALEIPTALALMADAGKIPYGARQWAFHGCVALGCVIRGETTHYELVAEQSSHWLMQLATNRNLPVGNGILTVENEEQAWARARPEQLDKGGDAARACLALVSVMAKARGLS